MAEMAIDAIAVAIVEGAAIGGFHGAADHRHRHMATQAEVADVGDILVGRGELGKEQGIATRIGHQAAFPAGIRLAAAAGIGMAGCAGARRQERPGVGVTDLGAGEMEIAQGGWNRISQGRRGADQHGGGQAQPPGQVVQLRTQGNRTHGALHDRQSENARLPIAQAH